MDESIERLVVGDLHAYREPLEAVDRYLEELTDRYRVFVNGDLFEGGMDAAAAVDWAEFTQAGEHVDHTLLIWHNNNVHHVRRHDPQHDGHRRSLTA